MNKRRTMPIANPIVRIWLLLVGATALVGLLAEDPGADPRLAIAVALAIAAFKARLVVLRYMELHHAPWPWRLAFEIWSVAAASGILAGYWRVA
jgi:hypothetical protein